MAHKWMLAVLMGVLIWGSPGSRLVAGFPALADPAGVLAAAETVDLERHPDADGVYLLTAERVRMSRTGRMFRTPNAGSKS